MTYTDTIELACEAFGMTMVPRGQFSFTPRGL